MAIRHGEENEPDAGRVLGDEDEEPVVGRIASGGNSAPVSTSIPAPMNATGARRSRATLCAAVRVTAYGAGRGPPRARLNHVPDRQAALGECRRVTRAGGLILASTFPNDDEHPAKRNRRVRPRAVRLLRPEWYATFEARVATRTGDPEAVAQSATAAGLVDAQVARPPADGTEGGGGAGRSIGSLAAHPEGLWREEAETMPMPRWWGQINKRVFNPLELRRGNRPVLTHVGRISGKTYRTPLDAHPVDSGYLFVLVYGPESDWVRNVLAAGHASLTLEGESVELAHPRLVGEQDAWQALPDTAKRPPGFLRITEYLRMDLVDS